MKKQTADDGVAEVIGFVLIIALIVAVAAVWILFYIPAQGQAVETEHARLVTEEIADIKYGIDLLWMNGNVGMNASRVLSPSPVQGTDLSGLLFLSPPLGTGTVTVSNGTAFWINTSTVQKPVSSLKITFNSANYYAQDLRIVYEGGAVFRGQKNEIPYVILPPSSGDTRLVLVCVPANYSEQQILGNIPLSLTYTYRDNPQTYSNANVSLYQPDPDSPWNSFLGSFSAVTVVTYDVLIRGPQ
ncbi:hypothetical protein SDC9_18349 [bioreactor metagenome]|uniref:Uncharacterized protein n=1 Tax=bioreactor metagenome TaxID=1076179 RepID=A0A644U032_9ZZZZ|nr:hypothetical protein [Methanocorpusculum sp.]